MKIIRRLLLCSVILAGVAHFARAETAEEVYAKKLDGRVEKIVATLKLEDQAVAKRVHNVIAAQYRTLNTWHDANDARLKELKKAASSPETEKAEAARKDIEATQATLKSIHDNYLEMLAKDLSPELIERVKDGMTGAREGLPGGKVEFTYKGYLLEYPAMTDEQKARVLAFLKEAREEAMDAGNMDEKSNIFNRYKGKINNWLSKQGVESKKSAEKKKADKE